MVKSNDFFRLIIVVLVGCIILFSSSATYIQIALGLTPVTICIFLSIPFLIVYLILNQLNLKLYLIDFFILLLLFWAFCSQIWTVDPDVWLNNFFWYFVCVVLFYIVRFSIVEKEDFKVIVFFCYASLIYNFFKINLDQNSYSNRYQIEDININFTSYSLVAILYIYILIYKYNFVNSRIIFLLFNLFTFLLVFLLQTRGALISIVLMWIWLVFKKNIFTKLKSIYIYMLLIVGLAITLGLFNFLLSIMDFYFFSERGTGDLSGRTQLWSLAYTIIKDNPIVGVGIGSFESISLTGVAVHNFYLNIILEMGLVGLLIYFFCFAFLFINKIKFSINEKLIFTFGLFLSFILPISISGSWQLAPILWVLFGVTFNILRVNENA